MKNAEKGRGGSIGLRRWALLALRCLLRCLALLGWIIASLASLAFLALFFMVVSGHVDTWANFFGHKETDGLSAGAHFARNLGFGLLALIGILMAAWRNREMSRQADAARDQIENESDRIAGERFSDAVKMLAQNEGRKPAIAARVGGIYALQSLAKNYISEYAVQVVKILVAYVRVNAQLTKIPRKDSDINFLGEDVKAAFAVLAQLLDERDESPEKKFELSDNDLDFSGCDFSHLCLDYRQVSGLRHYRWQGADLQGSDLRESDLRGSDLRGADFKGARMYSAQLQGANLRGANLEGARLHNADMRGASLRMESTDKKFERTKLQGAKLRGADLRGAAFSAAHAAHAADLSGADLGSAELQDTDLRKANLSGVGLLELPPNQIWHSGQPELKGVKSIEMSPDRAWDLEPYRGCPYALAGVLRNYKVIYDHFIRIPSRGLLKAARKLLDDNNLPKGFSGIWRKWLEEVDPETGIHPDLEKQNPISHNQRASE